MCWLKLTWHFCTGHSSCSQLPGIIASPSSPSEHAKNFEIILGAITSDEHVRAELGVLDVGGISVQALADGELEALHEFTGIFSVLCKALLQQSQDGGRVAASSAGSARTAP